MQHPEQIRRQHHHQRILFKIFINPQENQKDGLDGVIDFLDKFFQEQKKKQDITKDVCIPDEIIEWVELMKKYKNNKKRKDYKK